MKSVGIALMVMAMGAAYGLTSDRAFPQKGLETSISGFAAYLPQSFFGKAKRVLVAPIWSSPAPDVSATLPNWFLISDTAQLPGFQSVEGPEPSWMQSAWTSLRGVVFTTPSADVFGAPAGNKSAMPVPVPHPLLLAALALGMGMGFSRFRRAD